MRSRRFVCTCLLLAALSASVGLAHADEYSDTVDMFRHAGASASFFHTSYAYAVFPTIGKGGFGIGGAYGRGRVYRAGRYVGDASMKQVSIGFQLGGQAYSEILFFQNARALERFESGNFALSADASAVAITAGASATAGTTGTSAGASGDRQAAHTVGHYQDGVGIFTVAKGGLMYQAAVAGQKFSYRPVH